MLCWVTTAFVGIHILQITAQYANHYIFQMLKFQPKSGTLPLLKESLLDCEVGWILGREAAGLSLYC